LRICILYDCLFPWTIGGAERWYRQLAEAHAASGHEVSYVTLRQWAAGEPPEIPGVRVIAAGPRLALYAGGRRRLLPPLIFGLGVLWHLLRHGRRYDLVHTASFPFFSVLAAALVRPFAGYRLAVDWHEVWTREYWREYLGPLGGFGWAIQRLCARIRQIPFSFSRLHAKRAEALGTGLVTLLEGEYDGIAPEPLPGREPRFVCYAGRMIPEKRVPLLVEALGLVMAGDPNLRAVLIGQGPDLEPARAQVRALGLADRVALPGFVEAEELETCQRSAAVLVQPSSREGYGMVVVEAAARGVPVVVVAGQDNAATELVDEGQNGFVANQATPEALADAIRAALEAGPPLRQRVARWYAANRDRLSFTHSFETIGGRLAAQEERK
jgi:glycosyltransferase involved in cell wall biosynthesis